MANPNIVNVTSILGETASGTLTQSLANLVTAASNTVVKINSIIIANVDGTNSADVNIAFNNGSIRYLAKGVTVPAGATLVVLSKDTSIYLTETDDIMGSASTGDDLEYVISYEIIS